MKKFIAVVTTLFFLLVPTFLLAEEVAGTPSTGQESSVKAKKISKKTARSKKTVKKAAKKSKHAKKKGAKSVKHAKPVKDMDTMPARQ